MMRLSSTIALLLAAGPALAGGLSDPAPAPAPAPPPPAPIAVSTSDWSGFYAGGSFGTAEGTAFASLEGSGYGLHAGYLADLGTVVVGGEADYSVLTDSDDSGEATVLRLKGRVGYDAGQFQPYLVAGILSGDAEGTGLSGSFYGIGADFRATDNLIVGVEVLEHDIELDDTQGSTADAQTISLRASWKF